MRIEKIHPSKAFCGLKINGIVSAKNVRKLGEFTGKSENHDYIQYLEKSFNTDVVLNDTIDAISFSHKTYGDLSKFDCPSFPTKDFFSYVVNATRNITSAISKAKSAGV
jgi:hypothetical protein